MRSNGAECSVAVRIAPSSTISAVFPTPRYGSAAPYYGPASSRYGPAQPLRATLFCYGLAFSVTGCFLSFSMNIESDKTYQMAEKGRQMGTCNPVFRAFSHMAT